jgi:hypothetical protein
VDTDQLLALMRFADDNGRAVAHVTQTQAVLPA